MPIYINGLLLGLSLIMALGPQNIFLIRQGVKKHHPLLSAITCFLCDSLLIIGSVTGLHHILETHPALKFWMILFGSAFLLYYGAANVKCSFSSKKNNPTAEEEHKPSHWQIVTLALGFSLLNPHAIIDSLVLIGGGSMQFPGHQHVFILGVITSSLLWFTLLTFTAYFFSTVLSKEKIWRRIELFSGLLMLFLSIKLLLTIGQ